MSYKSYEAGIKFRLQNYLLDVHDFAKESF